MTQRYRAFCQLFLARIRELCREPSLLLWSYAFPVFLAVGLGIAFARGLDLSGPPVVAIADEGTTGEAAALAGVLRSHGIRAEVAPVRDCSRRLAAGRATLMVRTGPGRYEYVFDPRQPDGQATRWRVDDVVQRWKARGGGWPTTDRHLDEPGSRYIDFLIPGLMGLNLMAGGLWGIGFTIVDLRVRNLLKQFQATPMWRTDFLAAIVSSRLVLLVPEMLVLVLVGVVGFGMPVRGHPGTLALVLVAGGASFAGIGLLTACRAAQPETMTAIINLVMLPMWMLSGTFFSPERFPAALQPLVRVLPLTQLNEALRDVMLRGATLATVAAQAVALLAWGAVTLALALVWFRWR
jgi:ABC-type multidrug transport system permease subunit